MTTRSGTLGGPPLLAVLVAGCAGTLAAAWALGPGGEAGVRLLIRASARLSVSLFVLAFVARAARGLWPVPATAWLLRNRRYVGLAFAAAHGLHLAAIAILARGWLASVGPAARLGTLIGGGLAYLLILAMAATSNDRAVAALGPRRWKVLHGVGAHYLWVLFTLAHARRIPLHPGYAVSTAVLLGALGLRLAVALRSRRPALRAAG